MYQGLNYAEKKCRRTVGTLKSLQKIFQQILLNFFWQEFRIFTRFWDFQRDFVHFARDFEIFSYFVGILVIIGSLGIWGFQNFWQDFGDRFFERFFYF